MKTANDMIPSRMADCPPATLLADLHAAVVERLGAEARALTLERVVLGIFFTGVKLSNGAGGLCATPVKGVPEAVCCPSSAKAMPTPGKIAGRRAVDLLDDLYRTQDLRRALAIATLNALAETLWLRDGPPAGVECLDGDAFDALKIEPGRRVALVGAFPPYMRELRRRGQPFSVLEMDPSTLRPEEMPFYVPAERAPEVVPLADVFITTGTTLINGTLDGLLRLLRPGAEAAVIGPTATLVVDPYRPRGVTVIGGTRVRAPDELLELLAEGGSGYHFFGKTVERVTLRLTPAQ
ncbi:Rossmann-like domain-containing protein [Denitromonas sp.]|uniref:Rossmann-like domain-containing protein n=1 Tax=Zoogloeaceae TaxID=2008794 RepID=UPI003A8ACA57